MAKTNQVGFIEQHAEKLAVALAAVILVAVFALQVFKSPHATDELSPTKGETAQPSEFDDALRKVAEQTRVRIERRGVPTEAEPTPEDAGTIGEINLKPALLSYFTEGAAKLDRAPGPVGGKRAEPLESIPAMTQAKASVQRELVKHTNPDTRQLENKDITVAHITAVLPYSTMVADWRPTLQGAGIPLDIRFLRLTAVRERKLPSDEWGDAQAIETDRPSMSQTLLPELPEFDGTNLMAVRMSLQAFGGIGVQERVIQPDYDMVFWPEAQMFAGWMHRLPRTVVNAIPGSTARPGQEQPAPWVPEAESTVAGRPGRARPRQPGQRPGAAMSAAAAEAAHGMQFDMSNAAYGGTPAANPNARSTARGPRRDKTTAVDGVAKAVETANANMDAGEELLSQNKIAAAKAKFIAAKNGLRQATGDSGSQSSVQTALARADTLLARADMPQVTPAASLGEMCKNGRVQVWLHDTTCKPGEVYRYKLKLEVYNPVFESVTASTPLEGAPALALTTESNWTAEMKVPHPAEMFITSGPDANGQFKATVYRREQGFVLAEKIVVGIGDEIGTEVLRRTYVDPDLGGAAGTARDVDFRTGFVVVDCDSDKRIAPKGMNSSTVQVTLLAPDGSLHTRTLESDRRNPRYRELTKANRTTKDLLSR